jgi:hypothetical protein
MASPAARPFLRTSPFNSSRLAEEPATRFAKGDRVSHDRHGVGLVTGCEGDAAVYVDFGSGVRRIPTPSSKLHTL